MIRTALISLGLVAAVTAAAPSPAPSPTPSSVLHLRLVKSEPADKAIVTAKPTAIRLWFSAAPEMRYTSVTMKNAAGTVVEMAKAHQDSASQSVVVADIKGLLTPGKYAITWRTMSHDGHPVKGEIAFELTTANRAD